MARAPFWEIEIPEKLMQVFREYISDLPQYNEIMGEETGQESPDAKLRLALQMFIDRFNTSPPFISKYKAANFPNGSLLLKGALRELLPQLHLLHVRNRMTYSDQGVQFDQWDKSQEYLTLMQVLSQEVDRDMLEVKKALNAEIAYGHAGSPDRSWSLY